MGDRLESMAELTTVLASYVIAGIVIGASFGIGLIVCLTNHCVRGVI